MTGSTENLHQQLQAAQHELAEARARCEQHDAEHQAATKELDENRSALLFMLEDLETGRRKIEQAHREWMAALDVVNDPIFLHDKNFHILRCNKAYQQCAGIPFHELIGQPYYEVFPKTGAPLSCCLRAMNKAEEEEEEEEEEEVAAGDAIYRSRAFSLRDEQGAYLYSVHTLEDVTESHRAEMLLHESEEKFRKISESAQDAIIMMADKRISFWNAAAERIFGYTAAEALGQELHALIVPASAHAQFTQAFPHFQASGEGPIISKVIEVIALRKGGEEFPVELSVSATQFGGQWHAIGIVRDITQRKRAEEELRLSARLLDSTADSIFVADFDGNFVYLNEAAWKSRGYTRDELMGMNLHVLDVPEYEELIKARIRELIEKGQSTFESANRCKDGSIMPIEVSARIIEPGGRKLVLAAVRDITKRKQAEQALKKNEALLNEMGRLAKVGGWEFNVETRELIWTEEVYRIHEVDMAYKPSVDKGIEFYAPAYRPIIARVVQRAIEYGEPYDVELEFITAKGNHRWVHTNGKASQEHGKTITVFGTFQDITERKQAERRLLETNLLLDCISKSQAQFITESNPAVAFGKVLDQLLVITESEFGFIAETLYDDKGMPYIKDFAISDIAWSKATRAMYEIASSTGLEFRNMNTLFGAVVTSGKPVIANDPANDPRSGGLPEGHPRINTFLGIPIYKGEEQVGIFAVANRPGGYDEKLVEYIRPFTETLANLVELARGTWKRKQAEEKLRETRDYLENLFNHANAPIIVWDTSYRITMFNHAFEHLAGRDANEVIGKQIDILFPAERKGEALSHIHQTKTGKRWETVEIPILHSSGEARTVLWNSATLYSADGKNIVSIMAQGQDITERKQAEIALNHANRALAALGSVNRNLVHATNDAELFQATCDAIVQQRGYRLAWVGYVLHDESKSIKIMAHAGHDEGYLDGMQLTWAETERGMGPSGRAIRSGVTQLCQDMVNDPSYLLWRDAASQRGYASDIALPLIGESGSVFGILHVYSGETNAFTPAEITLLEEMAGDLSFGVRSLHTRHERDLAQDKIQQQLVQLQDNLEDTVRAIATIVEMRDPYTAGHQARVADLAAALAKQMSLPEEQIHAIHLAGIVHDLGKIKVPAEILSKPGKINDLEFGLIKIHPQAGYDILKGINFPWPIAQIVLQHHERLDGSGYPQGLKGEAILLEARILTVADVVEAMHSHRPYRPGLGIEVALAEITKQRGIYYDSRVVDACVVLFREQGYQLLG